MAQGKPVKPAIDYTAKDFDGFRDAMLAHAAQVFPEWTGRNTADFGVVLVELMAYMGDILSYYQEAAAREAFLSTATRRESIMELARMLGYTPDVAAPATGTVVLATEETQATDVFVPAGTKTTTAYLPELDGPLVYETTEDVTLTAKGGSATVRVIEGATAGTTPLLIQRRTAQEHEVPVEALGTSSGQRDQRITLAQSPAILDSIRLWADGGADTVEWRRVDSLMEYGPSDTVFEVDTSLEGVTTLVLGDGITGSIPAMGQPMYAAYRTGGGSQGNVTAGSLVDLADALTGVYIISSSAMTGGRDAEGLESIRASAPRAHRTQDRAVSLRDYADLALAVPGIAKARALARQTTSVQVRVVGAHNSIPSAELLDKTERYLQKRAVAGVSVTVSPGVLVRVHLGTKDSPILLGLYPNHHREDVMLAATQALQGLLSDTGTDFGMTIPVSRVYRLLDGIPGVEYAKIPFLTRDGAVQNGAQDIVCRDWEIPVPGNLYIATDGGL
ncbi:baseplate J/gp47 family protein [Streptomyces sp. UNOC14_S4]|uniref:baseplate J/gp47 family protein n=1 Tax=Streptomyces sp. UNOC14_S4 TaxID=2872340 RepID=UPI001E4581EB|nr:baseplate J/gp47 family protein [Streptomyces sp. UNOC14_S4]MCC3766033.1 baseplate J/gp47 family protein [Streptomyces sp. UNOC14_S4]